VAEEIKTSPARLLPLPLSLSLSLSLSLAFPRTPLLSLIMFGASAAFFCSYARTDIYTADVIERTTRVSFVSASIFSRINMARVLLIYH